MQADLEAAAADSVPSLIARRHTAGPPVGTPCANCATPLQGPYCHVCGQDADTHHRSILHLAWEAIEGLLHLDGRLTRTVPDLFLRPGRLAKDYLEGRVARHVPPFRTFLVALLLFILAAEHATHELMAANVRRQARDAATLATPAGRAAEVARLRREAAQELASEMTEATADRADDLKDPDTKPAKAQAEYDREVAKAQAAFQRDMAGADRVAAGLPEKTPESEAAAAAAAAPGVTLPHKRSWFNLAIRKATANPDYYLTVLFTWGHRLAVLLLPIVGFSLALVYRNKPKYFLYDHLVVAMDLLSFAFLTNAIGFVLPPPAIPAWLSLLAIWTPINMFQTLRGAYGSSILGAGLKTLVVWLITVVAFVTLMVCLMLFALYEL